MVLEKTFESPLDNKKIKLLDSKGNQYSLEMTDAEIEAPILWPPDVKSQLTGKDLTLGKIEGRRKRGRQRTKWLDGITNSNGHAFEQTLGDGDGQGGLACCSLWGHKE